MTMNRVINWWIKGVLLAGMMMLAGMAEAVDVSSAEGLASANGFKGKANWSGNKVTLTGNVELSETITIKSEGEIVLDLNGKTIQNSDKKKGITLFQISKGVFSVQDSGINGKILVSYTSSLFDTKHVQMIGVSLIGGTFNLYNGAIESVCERWEAIGVNVSGGTFNMFGGKINATAKVKTTNEYWGYGLNIENGNVQLKKGTITGTNESGIYKDRARAVKSSKSLMNILFEGYGIYKDESLLSMDATETANGTVEIKPIEYKITYDKVGGTEIAGKNYPTQYNVETPDFTVGGLTKVHYTFEHWHYDDAKVVENSVIKQGTIGNQIFTAHFTPIEYPIVYERNGGFEKPENENPKTYNVETKTGELGEAGRHYYTFDGWYKDQGLTQKFLGFDGRFYESPFYLYAKWIPIEYPVTFYNGTGEDAVQYTKFGEFHRSEEVGIDKLPVPIEDDRIFKGWVENGNSSIVNKIERGHEPVKLYATWNLVNFVVRYELNGGTFGTGVQSVDRYTAETTKDVRWKTGVDVMKPGFVFKGWHLGSVNGSSISQFPLDRHLKPATTSSDGLEVTFTFYAEWEEKVYDILFMPNGGDPIDCDGYKLADGVSKVNMPVAKRKGYKFLGWYYKDDSEGKNKVESIPAGGTEKITLVAHWEVIPYKITYEKEGGTLDKPIESYTVEDVVVLPTPKKEHYTFAGWYTQKEGGEKLIANKISLATGDTTVYARWTPNVYQVTFETNGGTVISGSFPYTYGETIKISKRTYRANYDFFGWYMEEALKTPFDDKNNKYGGDLTLYAKWGPKRYKIHYDMFHGEELPDDTYTTEESKQLPTNAIRPGFTFAGWYADDMLTVGPVTKIEKGESGDKTFYATWKPGYMVRFTQPENGKIEVKRRGDLLVSGDKVGEGVEITITATPTDAKYGLKALSIGGKTYTTSPQTIKMPGNDLYISAIFEDVRTVASAPEIITDPENTDNMLMGTVVKVTLKKTDESTTLYYSISDGPRKLYNGPFTMNSETATLLNLKAFAVKEGYKDGVTVRDMGFGVKKISVVFDLPAGITAINPLGGEVVSAIASGGTFEFSLQVDKNYFQSLDSMTVLANDSILTANADGIYRVEGASNDVKITVEGLENVAYEVTLEQSDNGYIYFTEDGSDGTLTLPCAKRISVTAVPDLNYKFGGWNDGSQANPYSLTVTCDTTLKATFVPDAKYFTITLPVLEGVTVKPLSGYSTEVRHGDKFHFYLRFADGYSAGNLIVKANGVVLDANEEGVYSLYRIAGNYSISVEGVVKDGVKLKLAEHVSAMDIATATDAMKAKLYPESLISLLATAPDGEYFYKWNDGNSDNPRIVTVREASGLLPLLQPGSGEGEYAKIHLPNVVGAGVGVQVDVHTIEVGGKMPFKVVLLPGYSQSEVKVTANGKLLEEGLSMRAASKSRTLDYSLADVDKEVKIEISGLKLDTYNVDVEQSEGGRASVSPSGRIECGSQVIFTAIPDAGNIFVKWSDGNTLNPYPFPVDGDTNLKAVFMRSDMAVANEGIAPSVTRIYARSGKLYVETKASGLYIWNMDGMLIKRTFVSDGCSVHPLPAGMYIVKVGEGEPVKIRIR